MTLVSTLPGAPSDWIASDLSSAIHARRVSCREVMDGCLDRIDRLNPRFNAIVSRVDPDRLLAQSDDCDRKLAQCHSRGWMHGFPIAVKDLCAVAAIPWTMGTPLLRHDMPMHDDLMVQRLKAAGAIVIGTMNTPESSLGSQTYNSICGAAQAAGGRRQRHDGIVAQSGCVQQCAWFAPQHGAGSGRAGARRLAGQLAGLLAAGHAIDRAASGRPGRVAHGAGPCPTISRHTGPPTRRAVVAVTRQRGIGDHAN